MPGRARVWVDERLPVDWDRLRSLTNEPVPGHLKKWWFALGGTPAYLFLVQIVTGILLTFYYVPTPDRAYASVRFVTEEVSFGWWVRSIHKWSSHLMIVAVVLHLFRVFFTGAYRRPRELNWVVGCGLLFTTLLFGFTGYSLVYEQLSYWGATVATNLMDAVPGIGPPLATFLRGGPEIGAQTLMRLFVVHIGLLPTLLIGLVLLHIALVRLHGVTEYTFAGEERRTFPFFPDHLLTEVAIGVALMIVVTALALLFPPRLGEPANPLVTPEHIKPEWYFFFTFRWLKLTSLPVGVLGTGVVAALMVAWPWIDAAIRRRRPEGEVSLAFGIAAIVVFLVFTVWEAFV